MNNKLIVCIRPFSAGLEEFKKVFTDAQRGKIKRYDSVLSFTTRKEYERFVSNLEILSMITEFQPSSFYQLAKQIKKDQSSTNKLINYYASLGVIRLEKKVVNGRLISSPVVLFDKIELMLKAA